MIEQWAMAELRELEARLSNVIEGLQAEVAKAESAAGHKRAATEQESAHEEARRTR